MQPQPQSKEELEHRLIQLKSYLSSQPLNGTLKELVRQQEMLLKNHVSTQPPPIKPIAKDKKKKISSTIKKLVWNINIGEEIGKTKCVCCK